MLQDFFQRVVLLGLLSCALGCGSGQPVPKKQLQVASGGPAVLTTEQRTASGPLAINQPPSTVVPATFHKPIEDEPPVKPYEQWTEQEAAAAALGRIGPAAVPDLIATLHSNDPQMRLKGVEVLGRMGPEAEPAVPHLIKLLDDPDLAVRKAAARTLGLVGPAAKDAVPALMRTLLMPPASAAP